MVTEGPPVNETLSITSGIERALRQEVGAADFLCFGVEHVDEQFADCLALLLGVLDACERLEEHLLGVTCTSGIL